MTWDKIKNFFYTPEPIPGYISSVWKQRRYRTTFLYVLVQLKLAPYTVEVRPGMKVIIGLKLSP